MNITKRHMSLFSALVVLTLFGMGTAFGATVEGRIQGLQCVVSGILCPVDNQDPHIAAESTFVVVTGPNSYILVPNLDRAVMARYLMSKVRVSGEKSPKYNSIRADKFEVYKDGKWRTAWSQEMENAARDDLSRG